MPDIRKNPQQKIEHTDKTDNMPSSGRTRFVPRLLPEARSAQPVSRGDQLAQRLKELPNVYGVPGPRAEQQKSDGTLTTRTDLWRAIYQGSMNRSRTSIESLAKLNVSRIEDLDDYCMEQARFLDIANKETYQEIQRKLVIMRKFKDPGQGRRPPIGEALNAFEDIKDFVKAQPPGYNTRLQETLRELKRIDVPQNQETFVDRDD